MGIAERSARWATLAFSSERKGRGTFFATMQSCRWKMASRLSGPFCRGLFLSAVRTEAALPAAVAKRTLPGPLSVFSRRPCPWGAVAAGGRQSASRQTRTTQNRHVAAVLIIWMPLQAF